VRTASSQFRISAPLFEAPIALAAQSGLPGHIGQFETSAAQTLGVEGITLLALRRDGYIGLLAGRDHLNAMSRCHDLVRDRRPA
jgi:hypothetical protein